MRFPSFVVHAQTSEWGDCVVDGVPTLACLEPMFQNVIYMASILMGIGLFVMFVIGSYQFLTSFGDPGKVKEARNTFFYAVIGVVVFVSAYIVLSIIDAAFLGGQGKIFELNIGNQ